MSVQYQDLCNVINVLFKDLNKNSEEAILRAYVNRSYYAIYHYVKQYIEQNQKKFDLSDNGSFKTGSHHRIVLVFEELCEHPTLIKADQQKVRKFYMQFKDFLSKRHLADYQLDKDVEYTDVAQCMKYFNELPKKNLESLPKDLERVI